MMQDYLLSPQAFTHVPWMRPSFPDEHQLVICFKFFVLSVWFVDVLAR